jgi:very-short-patch-repair endonuclease
MDRAIDALVGAFSERHHGVFAVQHLRDLDVAAHERKYRLASGRWASLHERVYRIVGTPLTWRGQVLGACWAGGDRAAASHRTAAELWELPGRRTGLVEITCPRWGRAQHAGLVVHESRVIDRSDVTVVDGIPVTTPERTLFDLAGVVGPITLDLAVENALRKNLTSVDALQTVLTRLARRGRAGTVRFRAAVVAHGDGARTESEAERLVLRLLAKHGLPEPVSQFEIRDHDGRVVARADFAYPDHKIAIEYDSYEHHTGRTALVRDSARRNAVVALGWVPIAATAKDLRTGGSQLATDIRQARALRTGVNKVE